MSRFLDSNGELADATPNPIGLDPTQTDSMGQPLPAAPVSVGNPVLPINDPAFDAISAPVVDTSGGSTNTPVDPSQDPTINPDVTPSAPDLSQFLPNPMAGGGLGVPIGTSFKDYLAQQTPQQPEYTPADVQPIGNGQAINGVVNSKPSFTPPPPQPTPPQPTPQAKSTKPWWQAGLEAVIPPAAALDPNSPTGEWARRFAQNPDAYFQGLSGAIGNARDVAKEDAGNLPAADPIRWAAKITVDPIGWLSGVFDAAVNQPIQTAADPQMWFHQNNTSAGQGAADIAGHNYLADFLPSAIKTVTGQEVPPIPSDLLNTNNQLKEGVTPEQYQTSVNWWKNSNIAKGMAVAGQIAALPAAFMAGSAEFVPQTINDPAGSAHQMIQLSQSGVGFLNKLRDWNTASNMSAPEIASGVSNLITLGAMAHGGLHGAVGAVKGNLARQATVNTVRQSVANDPNASRAVVALHAEGIPTYVVGGAVRDAALGGTPKDVDLMVANTQKDAVVNALSKYGTVIETGNDFPVLRFTETGSNTPVEIALARTERSDGSGTTRGFTTSTNNVKPEEDLGRRDFTANAMAVDLKNGKLIDPHNGFEHVRQGILRTVSPTAFKDDPLRIMRGLSAMSRFGLHPDKATVDQMTQYASILDNLPAERKQQEMDKMMGGNDPVAALKMAANTGVLWHIIPELKDSFKFDQKNKYHDLELFDHVMEVVREVSKYTKDPDVRMAALLHDVGKPKSQWIDESGNGHYYKKVFEDGTSKGEQHEELGARMTHEILTRLKYPVTRINRVVSLVKNHMFRPFNDARGARRFVRAVGDEHANDLMVIRHGDQGGKPNSPTDYTAQTMQDLIDSEREKNTAKVTLAINGNDLMAQLGIQPGPELGRIKNGLEALVTDNPELNVPDQLYRMAEQLQRGEIDVPKIEQAGRNPDETNEGSKANPAGQEPEQAGQTDQSGNEQGPAEDNGSATSTEANGAANAEAGIEANAEGTDATGETTPTASERTGITGEGATAGTDTTEAIDTAQADADARSVASESLYDEPKSGDAGTAGDAGDVGPTTAFDLGLQYDKLGSYTLLQESDNPEGNSMSIHGPDGKVHAIWALTKGGNIVDNMEGGSEPWTRYIAHLGLNDPTLIRQLGVAAEHVADELITPEAAVGDTHALTVFQKFKGAIQQMIGKFSGTKAPESTPIFPVITKDHVSHRSLADLFDEAPVMRDTLAGLVDQAHNLGDLGTSLVQEAANHRATEEATSPPRSIHEEVLDKLVRMGIEDGHHTFVEDPDLEVAARISQDDPTVIRFNPELTHDEHLAKAQANVIEDGISALGDNLGVKAKIELRWIVSYLRSNSMNAIAQHMYTLTHEVFHGHTMRMLNGYTLRSLGVNMVNRLPKEWFANAAKQGLMEEVSSLLNWRERLNSGQKLTPEEWAQVESAVRPLFEHLSYQLMASHIGWMSGHSFAKPEVAAHNVFDRGTFDEGKEIAHQWYTEQRRAEVEFRPAEDVRELSDFASGNRSESTGGSAESGRTSEEPITQFDLGIQGRLKQLDQKLLELGYRDAGGEPGHPERGMASRLMKEAVKWTHTSEFETVAARNNARRKLEELTNSPNVTHGEAAALERAIEHFDHLLNVSRPASIFLRSLQRNHPDISAELSSAARIGSKPSMNVNQAPHAGSVKPPVKRGFGAVINKRAKFTGEDRQKVVERMSKRGKIMQPQRGYRTPPFFELAGKTPSDILQEIEKLWENNPASSILTLQPTGDRITQIIIPRKEPVWVVRKEPPTAAYRPIGVAGITDPTVQKRLSRLQTVQAFHHQMEAMRVPITKTIEDSRASVELLTKRAQTIVDALMPNRRGVVNNATLTETEKRVQLRGIDDKARTAALRVQLATTWLRAIEHNTRTEALNKEVVAARTSEYKGVAKNVYAAADRLETTRPNIRTVDAVVRELEAKGAYLGDAQRSIDKFADTVGRPETDEAKLARVEAAGEKAARLEEQRPVQSEETQEEFEKRIDDARTAAMAEEHATVDIRGRRRYKNEADYEADTKGYWQDIVKSLRDAAFETERANEKAIERAPVDLELRKSLMEQELIKSITKATARSEQREIVKKQNAITKLLGALQAAQKVIENGTIPKKVAKPEVTAEKAAQMAKTQAARTAINKAQKVTSIERPTDSTYTQAIAALRTLASEHGVQTRKAVLALNKWKNSTFKLADYVGQKINYAEARAHWQADRDKLWTEAQTAIKTLKPVKATQEVKVTPGQTPEKAAAASEIKDTTAKAATEVKAITDPKATPASKAKQVAEKAGIPNAAEIVKTARGGTGTAPSGEIEIAGESTTATEFAKAADPDFLQTLMGDLGDAAKIDAERVANIPVEFIGGMHSVMDQLNLNEDKEAILQGLYDRGYTEQDVRIGQDGNVELTPQFESEMVNTLNQVYNAIYNIRLATSDLESKMAAYDKLQQQGIADAEAIVQATQEAVKAMRAARTIDEPDPAEPKEVQTEKGVQEIVDKASNEKAIEAAADKVTTVSSGKTNKQRIADTEHANGRQVAGLAQSAETWTGTKEATDPVDLQGANEKPETIESLKAELAGIQAELKEFSAYGLPQDMADQYTNAIKDLTARIAAMEKGAIDPKTEGPGKTVTTTGSGKGGGKTPPPTTTAATPAGGGGKRQSAKAKAAAAKAARTAVAWKPEEMPALNAVIDAGKTFGGKAGKAVTQAGHLMVDILNSSQDALDPHNAFKHPIEWFRSFHYSIWGQHTKLVALRKALIAAFPDVQTRRDIATAADAENATERNRLIQELGTPEARAVATAVFHYYQNFGRTLARAGVIDEAIDNYLPHVIRPGKGVNVSSVAKGFASQIPRRKDANGITKHPTIKSLQDLGIPVYDDIADTIVAHGNPAMRVLRTRQMISYLANNIAHFTSKKYGEFHGKVILSDQQYHKLQSMNDRTNYRRVTKGALVGPLDASFGRDGHGYWVEKSLADHFERLTPAFTDINWNPMTWIAHPLAFLSTVNTIFKSYKFTNPVHVWNVGSNVWAASGGWSPMGPFNIWRRGEDLRKNSEGMRLAEFNSWGLRQDPSLWENMPEDMQRVNWMDRIPVLGHWQRFMWGKAIYPLAIGLTDHLFEAGSKRLMRDQGIDVTDPKNAAYRENLGRATAELVNNALGFIQRDDMSNEWKQVGGVAILARDFTTAQIRATAASVAGKRIKSAYGGGYRFEAAQGVNQSAIDTIHNMETRAYQRLMLGGMFKFALTGMVLSTALSTILNNGTPITPYTNFQKDPLHTFDVYGGKDSSGKDIWYHYPLFGFQQELADYGLVAVKKAMAGDDPWSVARAPFERMSGKLNPSLMLAFDEAFGQDFGAQWAYDSDSPINLDSEKNLYNLRLTLDSLGVPDMGDSLEPRLLYALRVLLPGQGTMAKVGQPGTDFGTAMQGFFGTPQSLALYYLAGSRIGTGPTMMTMADGSQITSDQYYAQKDANTAAEQQMVLRARMGDLQGADQIRQQLGLTAAQAADAISYGVSRSSGSSGLPVPGGVGSSIFGPTSTATPSQSISLYGHVLDPQQSVDYQHARFTAQQTLFNQLKQQSWYQSADPSTKKALYTEFNTLATSITDEQYAQVYGIRPGTPLSDSQVQDVFSNALQIHDAIDFSMQNSGQYASMSQGQKIAAEANYNNIARTLILQKAYGSLSNRSWNDIQGAALEIMSAQETTREMVGQMPSYQDSQNIYEQDQMMNSALSFARTLAEDQAFNKAPSGFNTPFKADQITPIIQNSIQLKEAALNMLHQTDLYNNSDIGQQAKLDAKYSALSEKMAMFQADNKFGFAGAMPSIFKSGAFNTIQSSVVADQAFNELQNAYGGPQYITSAEQQLAAEKKQLAESVGGNVTPAELSRMQTLLAHQFEAQNPDYGAYLKAKTLFLSRNPLGMLYNSLTKDEYIYAATSALDQAAPPIDPLSIDPTVQPTQ